jgi:hypothetical protein
LLKISRCLLYGGLGLLQSRLGLIDVLIFVDNPFGAADILPTQRIDRAGDRDDRAGENRRLGDGLNASR